MLIRKIKNEESYQIVNQICAGIDVHKDFVSVTLLCNRSQNDVYCEYREYKTIKQELIKMREWLLSYNCKTIGIESTGKYWHAVHNAVDGLIDVNVYNARNMKNLPGKKTDKADSEWIAKITRHALLMPSFIPDKQIRDARVLSRSRKSLVQQRSRVRQSILGVLDSAGVKLSSVVSDVFGTSGMNLVKLLMSGEPITEKRIRKLVYGPLCNKTEVLIAAMDGYVRPMHIYALQELLELEKELTNKIANIELELSAFLLDSPEKKEVFERILLIPGFSDRSAMLLLSEIGFDLKTFPAGMNFCSWAGLAPGKNESAGTNKSGKIQVRQRYLRALLVEVALASTRCKNTFLQAKYHSLKSRIGGNKAVIAIAHCLAKAVYRAIHDKKEYYELGANYVSLNQYDKDLKRLSRITDRLGKDAVMAYLSQQEGNET